MPPVGLRLLFALAAALLAFLVLLGVDLGSLEPVKALALSVLLLVVALVVP